MFLLPSFLPANAWMSGVHHDGSEKYIQPQSFTVGDQVHFRLRSMTHSPIEKVFIRICPDGEQELHTLEKEETNTTVSWWGVTLTINEPIFFYRFLFIVNKNLYWYNQEGFCTHTPIDLFDFKLLAGFEPVEWVKGSTFYQIFPDTFFNGDPANDVRDNELLGNDIFPSRALPWGGHPSYWGHSGFMDFFNGDLKGIEQKIDYFNELGVNALYLTPVFTSHTQHRYSILDFWNVDPHLGGNDALISLTNTLHANNIRIILDLTLNHCSKEHQWFQAAIKDNNSLEFNYFTIDNESNYRGWLGDPNLPEFNYSSSDLREMMIGESDSVIRHWLLPPYNVDGWRLDASNRIGRTGSIQLARTVGRKVRLSVKSVGAEKYLIGENFFDSSPQLQGDELDAVQNETGAGIPILMWVAPYELQSGPYKTDTKLNVQFSTTEFLRQINEFQKNIPWAITAQQFNQITNHDSPRLITLLKGHLSLVKLALGILFTFPGSPSILYGDEVGMTGDNALESRTCMNWDSSSWNIELREFVRMLIRLRRERVSINKGGFQIILSAEDTFAFMRDSQEEEMIVVANRKPTKMFSLRVDVAGIRDGETLIELISQSENFVKDGSIILDELSEPGIRFYVKKNM
jgi:alpha-glucosidase